MKRVKLELKSGFYRGNKCQIGKIANRLLIAAISLKEMSRRSLALGRAYPNPRSRDVAQVFWGQRGAGCGMLCPMKAAEPKPVPGAKGGGTGTAALPSSALNQRCSHRGRSQTVCSGY